MSSPVVTVLGVGNTIMGDDGVGPELLARLAAVRRADARVEYVDGGTQGLELLPTVSDAHALLILDAVAPPADGSAPGSVVRLAGDQVPRLLAAKLSPHQVGLLDVLTAARLLGREPARVEVVGVVPADVDLRVGLSVPVVAALDEAVALASEVVDELLAEAGR
nr:hydrogenase maturation protease [Propionibacterium sp.]